MGWAGRFCSCGGGRVRNASLTRDLSEAWNVTSQRSLRGFSGGLSEVTERSLNCVINERPHSENVQKNGGRFGVHNHTHTHIYPRHGTHKGPSLAQTEGGGVRTHQRKERGRRGGGVNEAKGRAPETAAEGRAVLPAPAVSPTARVQDRDGKAAATRLGRGADGRRRRR